MWCLPASCLPRRRACRALSMRDHPPSPAAPTTTFCWNPHRKYRRIGDSGCELDASVADPLVFPNPYTDLVPPRRGYTCGSAAHMCGVCGGQASRHSNLHSSGLTSTQCAQSGCACARVACAGVCASCRGGSPSVLVVAGARLVQLSEASRALDWIPTTSSGSSSCRKPTRVSIRACDGAQEGS